MHATVGQRLVVHGAHVDDMNRDGEILEVRGKDGSPPYLVRWSDSGHEALVFPGADATIGDALPEHGHGEESAK